MGEQAGDQLLAVRLGVVRVEAATHVHRRHFDCDSALSAGGVAIDKDAAGRRTIDELCNESLLLHIFNVVSLVSTHLIHIVHNISTPYKKTTCRLFTNYVAVVIWRGLECETAHCFKFKCLKGCYCK